MDEEQANPRGYAYVAAQRAILAGPRASFPFAAPAWTPEDAATPGPEHADENQGNGVAAADNEAWRDSGISMMSSSDEDSSGEEGGGEVEDNDEDEDDDNDTVVGGDSDSNSNDDSPEETVVIPNALTVDVQTPGDGGSSAPNGDHMDVDGSQAPVDQAAVGPVTFSGLQLRPLQLRRELPDPTPLQLEIWSYITRWTLYPLPLPSPYSPAHRTLLALLRSPRIRFLPVSWQERLRARTPSLGTLTAIALYLGGRADFGSPCQSHCGQHGALVERPYVAQREEGAGQWKLEKKFAFPRCVKVPEALDGDREAEEVLGGRPCCNHFFRELRGAWETSEPFPPRPPGGLVWNGPMW